MTKEDIAVFVNDNKITHEKEMDMVINGYLQGHANVYSGGMNLGLPFGPFKAVVDLRTMKIIALDEIGGLGLMEVEEAIDHFRASY